MVWKAASREVHFCFRGFLLIDLWREPLKEGLSLNTSYLVQYLLTADLRLRLALLLTVDSRLETRFTIDSYLRLETCFTID